MGGFSWPLETELDDLRKVVAAMARRTTEEVRVVVSPYRICPLGAHIDHQGGAVSAMTINKGILLAFVPSGNPEMVLRSAQFEGEVRFRVDESHQPKKAGKANENINANGSEKLQECCWGRYARGAVYALKSKGNILNQGIIGLISGSSGLDSSGLSSSAAVGVAYLLALQNANSISVSPTENIEYDRLIENEYLGLNNGILDQSAILLSKQGCLTFMDCKTKEYKLVKSSNLKENTSGVHKSYKILLACSGLKHALTSGVGYNRRVAECREAARVLLDAVGKHELEAVLSNVEREVYEAHKDKLDPLLARRAEHYFSENMRVMKGVEAWTSGRMDDFGKLITASGRSSIQNYECGCKPLIELYEVLVKAPGVLGARFSGAGFRGCCIALVDADLASEAALFVKAEYNKLEPELVGKITQEGEAAVLICESGDGARVITAT
ncbi:galacturonokinase [Beta vulgaris subsp. vulgaris]|uniref:galacturonokinase n=1 Tax=Beta vulgaris subsp. vulgaris TaxID=3555 RepID=UPI002036EC1B|nr:galacturonokinase [Beta vulgaris subsp. vulgaris]